MNERIKQFLPSPYSVDYQHNEGPLDYYTEKELEKFAELIIFECVKIAVFNGDSKTGKKIKEHFGVE